MMICKEVCHYTKKDVALEKILYTKKLQLGQFGFTNDPRESKAPFISSIIHDDTGDSTHTDQAILMQQAFDVIDVILTEEWKVLCVTCAKTKSRSQDRHKKTIHNHLAPGYSRPRMWAQYAENHKGVCLIFDGVKLNRNIHEELGARCQIIQGRVLYNDYTPTRVSPLLYSEIENYGSIEAVRRHTFAYHQDYFFRKYPDWEGETEYRWIAHSLDKSPEYVSVDNAIKAVLVGVDFPQVYEHSLILLCKELKISAGRMEWVNGLPYPNFGSIYKP
jgi:hypothetical protein